MDCVYQPLLQIHGHGNILVDPWPHSSAQQIVLSVLSCQFPHVPPMLAMDPFYSRDHQGTGNSGQSGNITGVNNIRLQFTHKLGKPPVHSRIRSWLFVHDMDRNRSLQALDKIAGFGKTDDRMT